jgi:hypothetical protein
VGLDKITGIWDTLDMGYYSRRRRSSTVFHAAHNAVAARASFDPSLKPDSTLIAARQANRPNYKALASIPADWDYIVLDVPFGKRGSTEVRQWAKTIGARWNTSHKEWRITASRVCSDRLAIINSLRLYLNHTTKAAPIFLARIGSPSCKVILQIPFEEKDTAKGDGARWDSVIRKWYFPMQGNLGSASFSQTIAKYEAKGWVDVVATEAHNAPHLGMTTTAALSSMREPNEQTAASKSFSLGATATKPISYGGSNPTAGGTRVVPASGAERTWFSAVLNHANNGTEVGDQWLLRKVNANGSEGWIRIHRIDGCPVLCLSTRTVHGTWLPNYGDADAVRASWTDAVQNLGFTVYAHQRNTGSQMAVLVATGKWNPSNTLDEISAARDTINDRIMGRRQTLP